MAAYLNTAARCSEGGVWRVLEGWVAGLAAAGLWGLGLLFLIEGAGLPLPVEIPFLLSGALAHAGRYPYWSLVILAWSATVVGNLAGYGAGYIGGRKAVERLTAWAGISAARLDSFEAWFRRHGLRLLFVTRWINWGFGQSLWLAGLSRIPLRRFAPFILVLNLAWAALWLAIGASMARLLSRLGVGRGAVVVVVLVGVIVAVAAYVIYRLVRRERPEQAGGRLS